MSIVRSCRWRVVAVCCVAAICVVSGGCPLTPAPPRAVSPADGAIVDGSQATLIVSLSPRLSGSVQFFGRRLDTVGEDFTIVALPDTQYYSASYPEIFLAQTEWIARERSARNIVAVLHLGDIVDDASKADQWEAADAAIGVLDALPDLPVGLAVGNHDQFPRGDPDGTANFNTYFPASRFDGRGWYGGHFGGDNDNSYILFSGGGIDFIAVMLEFHRGGDPEVLAWADDLLKRYADRRAIVVTHFALTGHVLASKFSFQGRAIRDALGDNANLFLMLGGHFCGTGARLDDFAASRVASLLADYQCWPNGGDGWLRLLEFSPADSTLRVRTYSPTRDEYLDGPRNEFVLPFEPPAAAGFAALGGVDTNPDDGEASLIWNDLEAGARYEWFARLEIAGATVDTPMMQFETR